MSTNVYAKFRCAALRIKKALGIFRELIPTTTTTTTRNSCAGRSPVQSIGHARNIVDAVMRRIGKSRHGGHNIANISRYCERI